MHCSGIKKVLGNLEVIIFYIETGKRKSNLFKNKRKTPVQLSAQGSYTKQFI